MHLQCERVSHLSQWPPRCCRTGTRPDQRRPDLFGQPGEHAFDPLSLHFDPPYLQVGQVMVELIGQRRQRAAARSAEHDLPHQVTGRPVRQHGARHSQHFS